mmetsp:Transcript_39686/g.68014  ORF Transcript_39686/g.68014 Transcript_39686/m.68014 type:complete len:328 (-) Transcript_39686:30-1013(-)
MSIESLCYLEDINCFDSAGSFFSNVTDEQLNLWASEPFLETFNLQNESYEETKEDLNLKESSTLQYKSNWCLASGKPRKQQFWVYCEGTQTNYIRFDLYQENLFPVNQNSKLMKDSSDNILLVSDASASFSEATYFLNNVPSIFVVDTSSLTEVHSNEFSLTMTLSPDKEQPHHPLQGTAESIIIKSNQINTIPKKHALSNFPLSFMFQIKFMHRVEGWFRLHVNISHKESNMTIKSTPFILNNPRLKKRKEHTDFTPTELKFMHVYSHFEQKNETNKYDWIELGGMLGHSDPSKLISNASKLFPPIKKAQNQKHVITKRSCTKNIV